VLSKDSVALVIIVFVALVVYSNIYQCPFVFDDIPQIQTNLKIRSLLNYLSLGDLLKPRAVVYLTFALNYQFGKLNVFGYHLINVLIHIINGFLVYFLAHTIFRQVYRSKAGEDYNSAREALQIKIERSKLRTNFQSTIDNQKSSIYLMSLLTALIFIAHPIQSQVVTYTVQRSTSMAAMFFLASVLFYLKARIIQQGAESREERAERSGHPSEMRFGRHENEFHGVKRSERGRAFSFRLSSYFFVSIVCGILAFLSKQNTASLPGVILLTEYLLMDRTWEGLKRKIPWFFVTFALWGLFVLYIVGFFSGGIEGRGLLEDVSDFMQETEQVSRWSYLCTQFNVLVIYLRLLFLPIGQNLDYQYPFKTGFFDGYTPLAFVFLIGVIAIGIWNIRKRPVIAFGIFWFFITLSVESSLIPIQDALFEHRLYLPMFGFALIATYLVFHFLSKRISWAVAISVVLILSLGTATYLRNRVWKDSISFWTDVVLKTPLNAGAHSSLGLALQENERIEEAISHFVEAVKIDPEFALAHNNLGIILMRQGRFDEAIKHYSEALRIKPNLVEAHNNLGGLLASQRKFDEAISHFSEALQIDPDNRDANYNLGKAIEEQGKGGDRKDVRALGEALRINPEDAKTHFNLANILAQGGSLEDAIDHYTETIRIDPESPGAHINLGIALKKLGRYRDASRHFKAALKVNPEDANAHYNLGNMLVRKGILEDSIIHYLEDAIAHYTEAIRINPEFSGAHNNLGIVLKRKGRYRDAMKHFRESLRINPDYVEAHFNAGDLLMKQGDLEEAIHHFKEALRIKPKYAMARHQLERALKQKEKPDAVSPE